MGLNMQTKSDSHSVAPAKQGIAAALRAFGWICFWLELVLAVVCGIALLFAVSGRNISDETVGGIGIGIFWAIGGVLASLFSVFVAFRYTGISKALRSPNTAKHPKKADVTQLLRLGVIAGLAGMLLGILGAGSTLGVLVAKSVSMPQLSVAAYDPSRSIRGLDVFVAMANLIVITANFLGTVAPLWMLNWLHRD